MALVKDIMSHSVITVPHHAEVDVAIELILTKKVSALAVVDSHGALLGVISEYDVLELCGKIADSAATMEPCSKYMTSPVKSVSPHASIDVVAKIFKAASIRRLFVTEGDKLVGVISRRDLLKYIRENRHGKPVAAAIA
jgi:CBS domain-containing protein